MPVVTLTINEQHRFDFRIVNNVVDNNKLSFGAELLRGVRIPLRPIGFPVYASPKFVPCSLLYFAIFMIMSY